jgi:DNA-binding LacI/PurR family transcriptional regulator
VSVSTVSRVLNGSPLPIRPETHERVWAASTSLGYRPNAVARGLALATTGTLGLLVPSLRNPVYAEIIRGAFDSAWDKGFVVLLAEDTGSHTAQTAYERLVQEGRIDGLLIASSTGANRDVLRRLLDESVPCVFVNRRLAGSGRNVVMRERDAGRLAAEHLLELGHRRLAIVAGPRDLDTSRLRCRGFVETAERAGATVDVHVAALDEAAGFNAMGEILDGSRRPTGAFVSNLSQAIGAVAAARRHGVRIPDELSLIANDEDPFVEYLDTPLTTIRMPLEELGRLAVGALVDQLSGDDARDVLVPSEPELVLRESTGPPAAG